METWKLSSDPEFIAKVRDVVGLYMSPPEHALVLAVDENSRTGAGPHRPVPTDDAHDTGFHTASPAYRSTACLCARHRPRGPCRMFLPYGAGVQIIPILAGSRLVGVAWVSARPGVVGVPGAGLG